MSTNYCVVTKLAGAADNERLPYFGKVTVKVKNNVSGTTEGVNLKTGNGALVHVDCTNMTWAVGGTNPGTNVTIPKNTTVANVLSFTANQNVKFEIDAYNIIGFSFVKSFSELIGFDALKSSLRLVRIGGGTTSEEKLYFNSLFADFSELTSINGVYPYTTEHINEVLSAYPNLTALQGGSFTSNDAIELTETIKSSGLKYLGYVKGNIENLPVTIENIVCSSPGSGSIDTLISSLRGAGRTNGILKVQAMFGTIGGVTFRQYLENKNLWEQYVSNSMIAYITWTDSSIDVVLNDPGFTPTYDFL